MTFDLLKSIYQNNGIVGAGGAGFPTYAKLSLNAETILLNCAECEPLITANKELVAKFINEILTALDITLKAVEGKSAVICVKSVYKNVIDKINELLPNYKNIELCLLDNIYPAGDELVLIKKALGVTIDAGCLPISKGIIVFNAESMYNCYNAINNIPVTHKYVTIGGAVKNPVTLRLPIGYSVYDAVELADGVTIDNPCYIVGGLMMGSIANKQSVVTKTTNAVLVVDNNMPVVQFKNANVKQQIARASGSCHGCKLCTVLCPRHNLGHNLKPHKIMQAVAAGGINNIVNIKNLTMAYNCSGCGVCELFACPHGLSPRVVIKKLKGNLIANNIAKSNVEGKNVNQLEIDKSVPISRLIAKLDVKKYVNHAKINDIIVKANNLLIPLKQNIGVPSKPIVEALQIVKEGDMIAKADVGLSVCLHSPINGIVKEITNDYINIVMEDK